jgi:predicted nucleic acid-binding protein
VLVVLDTNVLVAALRSRRGASFQVLSLLGTGAFDVAISVPLVLEYEATLLRHIGATNLAPDDVLDIVDYICSVAKHQLIFFLWRPLLKDPNDDMVAEVAVASGCDAVVTHNGRDFEALASLGLRAVSPKEFLGQLGRSR